MSKQGRILIVDDEKKWGEELAALLSRNGFSADAVENVTQALEQLSNCMYHIVVLDIRLPSDTEGIDLLEELGKRGLKEATEVIMHSAYGTLEQMRLAFKDYDVADFIPKAGPDTFLKSVQQVFYHKMNINTALDIRWQMKSQVEQIVSKLEFNGKRVGRNFFLRKRLTEELDDLFCRLFYDAETILVRSLTPGWSGTGVVLIQPFFKDRGRGEDVIVKFGAINKIKKEDFNFQRYVKSHLSKRRSTAIHNLRYTPLLGGIVYSLLGAGNDQLVDFADFYHSRDKADEIITALNHLFQETCENWFANRTRIQPLDLAADYQQLFDYSAKKVERMLASQLPSVQVAEKLTFISLNTTRTFTNPLIAVNGLSFTRYTSTCTTHGDFNPHNLFVDPAGFTWLIDFQATGPGHILRDFAMLDSAIRFQLLSAQEATLGERLYMEDILCKAEHFSQVKHLAVEFTSNNPQLQKAFTSVLHLRTLAGALTADDIGEYYIALFYNALNTLQFSSLAKVQHEHALLCASLLADKLGLRR